MSEDAEDGWIDDVDPQVREFLRRTSADYRRFSGDGPIDVARQRAIAEKVRFPWRQGGPEMAATLELRVGPQRVRLRIHRPNDNPLLPVLVYIHGGGWTVFSLDTHDRLMREYAARTGCAVAGVDYSLSPEVRFPHALGEIAQVLAWIASDGASAGLDPARVAVGGDSAGANLSLASALQARDSGDPLPAGLLLNYGVFDDQPRASHTRYDGDRYMLTNAEMEMFWNNYRGDDRSPDPLARPLLADMSGLPPCFLCIPQCDILADESLELARRLAEAGVEVTSRVYAGATHSFLEAVSISSLAERALDEASRWLRQLFAP